MRSAPHFNRIGSITAIWRGYDFAVASPRHTLR
jgi:hypothetical protein